MIGSHLEPEEAVFRPARSLVVMLMSVINVQCQKSNVKSEFSVHAYGFALGGGALGFCAFLGLDAHAVERAADEEDSDQEEGNGEDDLPGVEGVGFHLQRQLHREQAEEPGELDDGVEGDGGSVLEGVADGVAD